jgi:hypothetical protein
MKAFSYDRVHDSIFIEPGVLLGEVYDGLQSQGVAPVGGRVEFVYSPHFLGFELLVLISR